MDIVVKILQFVMSFSLLVIIHELGHFMFARMFGIRVEKFYLFFNPGFSLFKFKIGETEYGMGWIPFGGYVKIAGMVDESMDTEQMESEPQPYEFRSKPAWQRLLVMIGGVLMNVILAIIIYIGVSYAYGDKYIANDDIRYGYQFNELAHRIGFENGDRVVSVGGEKIEEWNKVFLAMILNDAPDVVVLRDGQQVVVPIRHEDVSEMLESKNFMLPRIPFVVAAVSEDGGAAAAGIVPGDSLVALNGVPMTFFDQYMAALTDLKGQTVELSIVTDSAGVRVPRTLAVNVSEDGLMGVAPSGNYSAYFPVQTREYTFLQSIPAGIKRTGAEISSYWKQLKMIFQPKTKAYKGLGGPLSIANIFPNTWNWEFFWGITAFLSLILAVMNILPIPALDGGHVLFLLYEVITGRKPGDKFMEYAQWAGMILLFGLILFATGNDIYRLFIK